MHLHTVNSLGRRAWGSRVPWKCSANVFTRSVTTAASLAVNDLSEGEDACNTGLIKKQENESLFFFNHLVPYKSSKWDFIQDLSLMSGQKDWTSLKSSVSRLSSSADLNVEITKFTPMKRDGGAFVNFLVPSDLTVQQFNQKIIDNVSQQKGKGLWNRLSHPQCYPVKGSPWIEDLYRFPSRKIKVSLEGPDLTQEQLYLLFRRYGIIWEIASPRQEPSEPLKCAYLSFKNTGSAIAAKQCVSGLSLEGTVVHVDYSPIRNGHVIQDYIFNHPRISIPAIIGLFATVAVLVFDPIREFFIGEKVTQSFSLSRLVSYTGSILTPLFDRKGPTESLWDERFQVVKELQLWLTENVNTFIVVQGPKGTGKKEMVTDHALSDRQNVLVLDCDKMIKARSESKLLSVVAEELGYWPAFPWLNSISSLIDLGVQSLTGQKSGISESKETQIRNMLSLTGNVLRDIALRDYSSKVLEGKGFNSEDDYLQQNPTAKPVVVIDEFQALARSSEKNAFVYKEVADWAAALIASNTAHVVFISEDVGSSQILTESLPNQVFKMLHLSDMSSDAAKKFVLDSILKTDEKSMELGDSLVPLGGRMLDLQAFIRRILSGESPQNAVEEMINQTSEQLVQMFITNSNDCWSAPQTWTLIKLLAENDSVAYSALSKMAVFKPDLNVVLTGLERSGLISLVRDKGIVVDVKPGKPLFLASFKHLANDRVFFNEMEKVSLNNTIIVESGKILKWEDELSKFRDLSENKMFKPRISYLADKIALSTAAIEDAEKRISQM